MSEELCWKCEEKVRKCWSNPETIKLFHCHHEPKEKEKCWWCEWRRRYKYQMGNLIMSQKAKFCPECGRKL